MLMGREFFMLSQVRPPSAETWRTWAARTHQKASDSNPYAQGIGARHFIGVSVKYFVRTPSINSSRPEEEEKSEGEEAIQTMGKRGRKYENAINERDGRV
jgi:hypothetical protein